MKLCKRIIREIALMGAQRGATREELSLHLRVSLATVGEAVKMLLDKGFLISAKDSVSNGGRTPQRLFFGRDASVVSVESSEGGFSVSLRSFDGAFLQRKFIAEDMSLSAEDRILAAASSVISYCGIFTESRDGFALGIVGAEASERKIWRRTGADLVLSGDILAIANKQFGGTDLLVRVDERETAEILVMRDGEIINSRAKGRFVSAAETISQVVEFAMMLGSDNVIVSDEKGGAESEDSFASLLRQECSERGARARVIIDCAETREQLLCEVLRDKLCDRIFK